jgi:hypothetical protein
VATGIHKMYFFTEDMIVTILQCSSDPRELVPLLCCRLAAIFVLMRQEGLGNCPSSASSITSSPPQENGNCLYSSRILPIDDRLPLPMTFLFQDLIYTCVLFFHTVFICSIHALVLFCYRCFLIW